MDQASSRRCPHFQLVSDPIETDGPPVYLTVRRCLLTERMIGLLAAADAGEQLAHMLTLHSASGGLFAFVGPDLEAVTQRSCLAQRCENSCTPAYSQHLVEFGIEDPAAEDVNCHDGADDGKAAEPAGTLGLEP